MSQNFDKNRDRDSLNTPWVGRFAPSPSGPLHLGSLVAALASFFIAKQRGGQWLLRIEDLDPPRVVEGADQSILQSLEDFGLEWDGPVVYQSHNFARYQTRLMELMEKSIVYGCDCSRKQVEERTGGSYDGYCKERGLLSVSGDKSIAYRVDFSDGKHQFNDQVQGLCEFSSPSDCHDFIIKRKDGLYAYQLAVVCDDIEQGVNHVVRGYDILDSTPRQNFLYQCFAQAEPIYFHIPLVKNDMGIKFSKSAGSQAIESNKASELLVTALGHLGQKTEAAMLTAKPRELIAHFVKHWQTENLPSNLNR
jgi:glutamyl-Q tRNA(Asp) synthetase